MFGSVQSLEVKLGVLLPWNIHTGKQDYVEFICINFIFSNTADGLLVVLVTSLVGAITWEYSLKTCTTKSFLRMIQMQ